MKINQLELKNFRIHEGRTFNFSSGVVLLRGGNEAGKTTICEAVGYCLFGSALLMDPLEKVVTRGKAKSAIRVNLSFEAAGVEYFCTRGPSGAELTQAGTKTPLATGQNEVTAKVEELLGVPPGKALQTMFARQDEIRGILAAGPTATAQFIESLGDFTEVNAIIKKLEGALPADQSSVKVYEAEITATETRLKELAEAAATNPPETRLALAGNVKVLEAKLLESVEVRQKAMDALAKYKVEQKTLQDNRVRLFAEANRLKEAKAAFNNRIAVQRAQAEAATPEVAARLEALEQLQRDSEIWNIFKSTPEMPEVFWEGDEASLAEEIARLRTLAGTLQSSLAVLKSQRQSLQEKKLTSTLCPVTKEVCEKISADPKLIERTNQEIEQQIKDIDKKIAEVTAEAAETSEDSSVLVGLLPTQGTTKRWLDHSVDLEDTHLTVNRDVVPWEIKWVTVPEEPAAVDPQELNRLRQVVTQGAEARKFLEAAGTFDELRLVEVSEELRLLPPTDASEVEKQLSALNSDVTACDGSIQTLKDQRDQVKVELISLEQSAAIQEAEVTRLNSTLAGHKVKIKTLQENAAILRAARAARLAVMDLLWGRVMGGISGYFSALRGVPSTVTRSEGGFLVDGSASRLSGSTLDVLGLALRMAVCKVFSHCGILLLDEPSHGCDEARTAQMTATIASAGFDQIILVTHKEVDESVEGSLIEI